MLWRHDDEERVRHGAELPGRRKREPPTTRWKDYNYMQKSHKNGSKCWCRRLDDLKTNHLASESRIRPRRLEPFSVWFCSDPQQIVLVFIVTCLATWIWNNEIYWYQQLRILDDMQMICAKRDVRKAGEEEDWKKKTRDRGGWKRLSDEAVKKLRAAPHPWQRETRKRVFSTFPKKSLLSPR